MTDRTTDPQRQPCAANTLLFVALAFALLTSISFVLFLIGGDHGRAGALGNVLGGAIGAAGAAWGALWSIQRSEQLRKREERFRVESELARVVVHLKRLCASIATWRDFIDCQAQKDSGEGWRHKEIVERIVGPYEPLDAARFLDAAEKALDELPIGFFGTLLRAHDAVAEVQSEYDEINALRDSIINSAMPSSDSVIEEMQTYFYGRKMYEFSSIADEAINAIEDFCSAIRANGFEQLLPDVSDATH